MFRSLLKDRIREMRFDVTEAAGGLGDLGTFIPITVSLVATCGLDAGAVLFFAGLFNLLTGLLFGLPVPVQPMKAIAAVAIAESLTPGAIAAAGLGTGLILLLLGVTRLVEVVERHVPRAVVRGIQLGIGLKLLIKGLELVRSTPPFALDGWIIAAAAAALVLAAARWERFPSALVLLGAGLALLAASPPPLVGGTVGWAGLPIVVPTAHEWLTGILRGTLPQVPLTLLNSVIAVCALSGELFPGRLIGTRPMAISVGAMNLVGCWFGAMPMCHGAGGLAGQYRFGARTGGSVVMLGAAKMLLALALGSAATAWLAAFPSSILGVLLGFAGAELALPARRSTGRDAFFVVAITAGATIGVNTVVGVLLGLGATALLSWAGRRDAAGSDQPPTP